MLSEEPHADVALAGFPTEWREPELRVFLAPIGEYEEVKIINRSDTPVCLIRAKATTLPALLSARLKTCRLMSSGLQVVMAREHVPQVKPVSFLEYKFRREDRAALLNLRSQTELNGSPCTILKYDQQSSRWLVRLDSELEDNEILVSEANLLPLWLNPAQPTPESQTLTPPAADSAAPEAPEAEEEMSAEEEGGEENDATMQDADDAASEAEGNESKASKGKVGGVKKLQKLVVLGFLELVTSKLRCVSLSWFMGYFPKNTTSISKSCKEHGLHTIVWMF